MTTVVRPEPTPFGSEPQVPSRVRLSDLLVSMQIPLRRGSGDRGYGSSSSRCPPITPTVAKRHSFVPGSPHPLAVHRAAALCIFAGRGSAGIRQSAMLSSGTSISGEFAGGIRGRVFCAKMSSLTDWPVRNATW